MERHEPEFVASDELLLVILGREFAGAGVFLDLDFFNQTGLGLALAGVVGSAEILQGECVVEEVAERIAVQDVILRISVVAEEDWIECAAVLLCHPVDPVDLGDWSFGGA